MIKRVVCGFIVCSFLSSHLFLGASEQNGNVTPRIISVFRLAKNSVVNVVPKKHSSIENSTSRISTVSNSSNLSSNNYPIAPPSTPVPNKLTPSLDQESNVVKSESTLPESADTEQYEKRMWAIISVAKRQKKEADLQQAIELNSDDQAHGCSCIIL